MRPADSDACVAQAVWLRVHGALSVRSAAAAVLAVAWVLSANVACRAAPAAIWRPQPIGQDKLPDPTGAVELIKSLRVADTDIVLEETALESARDRLGGSLGRSGDAGGSLRWLCAYGADADGRWVMWLLSGDLHGVTVGGFQMKRIG
jgi:hypothetical protein